MIMNQIKRKHRILSILTIIGLSVAIIGCGSNPKYRSGKSSAKKSAVVKMAKKMLGVKYSYGGTSPNRGFDCSGLVQYSHKSVGVSLPRTTSQQYKAAKWIAKKHLKAGDLVFFKIIPSRAVSHVGIYLGNSRFIHAPSSGKRVKISSMKAKYWKKRFTGAGRVL